MFVKEIKHSAIRLVRNYATIILSQDIHRYIGVVYLLLENIEN